MDPLTRRSSALHEHCAESDVKVLDFGASLPYHCVSDDLRYFELPIRPIYLKHDSDEQDDCDELPGLLIVNRWDELFMINVDMLFRHYDWHQDFFEVWNAMSGMSYFSNSETLRLMIRTPRDVGEASFVLVLEHRDLGTGTGFFMGSDVFDIKKLLQDQYFGPKSITIPSHGELLYGRKNLLLLPVRLLEIHIENTRSCIEDAHQSLSIFGSQIRQRNPVHSDYIDLERLGSEYIRLLRRWEYQQELSNDIRAWLSLYKEHLDDISHRSFDGNEGDEFDYYDHTGQVDWLLNRLARLGRQSQAQQHSLQYIPYKMNNLSALMFHLNTQRDNLLNLRLAKYSARIADQALKDSTSMKTIAILTLVFLPGAFVAAIFSTSMFNWQAQAGEPVVSKYLWIYFAVTVGITLVVILTWAWWNHIVQRKDSTMDEADPSF